VVELFLDTSIQVDRIVAENDPARRTPIERLLAEFDFHLTCSYSRLEFKRVVIQNLALTLRYIGEENSFFRAFHRANRLQRQRRATTLTNIMAWIGYRVTREIEVTAGEGLDLQMALQAGSIIRNAIRYIWRRFDRSVGSVLNGTQCVRATEGPKVMADGSIDASIPESRCREKQCNNANFLRSRLPDIKRLCTELERIKKRGGRITDELEDILATLRQIERDLDKAYDYKTCLAIGDLWMHLECLKGGVKNFATRNYKESEVLCPIFGLKMKLPEVE
jgi:hypothetical protein